jgi:hypothetical protein
MPEVGKRWWTILDGGEVDRPPIAADPLDLAGFLRLDQLRADQLLGAVDDAQGRARQLLPR